MCPQTRDSAGYWVATSGEILTLKFLAVLECSGQFAHILVHVSNMETTDVMFQQLELPTVLAMLLRPSCLCAGKLRSCKMLIRFCSCDPYHAETVCVLGIPPNKRPGVKHCWREMDNSWVLMVSTTEALFKDILSQDTA